MNGMVFWLTGLPGAGKTTVAKALYEKLKPQVPELIYLDGDVLRQVFGNFQYDPGNRMQLAQTYSRLCLQLSRQGHSVICATVSMFHAVREWNRENIPHYHEVYLEVPYKVLRQRNQKDLYSGAENGQQQHVHGVDMDFETPTTPDSIIVNDGRYDVAQIVDIICKNALKNH